MHCQRVEDDGKTVKSPEDEEEEIITARYVAIATGHHASPVDPKFRGEETFKGIKCIDTCVYIPSLCVYFIYDTFTILLITKIIGLKQEILKLSFMRCPYMRLHSNPTVFLITRR